MENNDEEFLKCLNTIREQPTLLIPFLQSQIKSFISSKELLVSQGIVYLTNEGRSLWMETIQFLQKQQPIRSPLLKHPGLCKAAADHQKDLCMHNKYGHKGTDGSNLIERVYRYCRKGFGMISQLIGCDFEIRSLVIDDGIYDRGDRNCIFNKNFKYIGWSIGKQQDRYLVVFILLDNYLQCVNSEYQIQNKLIKKVKSLGRGFGEIQGGGLKSLQNGYDESDTLSKNKRGKRINEKRQNTKILYQNGAKITETSTKFIYNDGTVEENIDRCTLYQNNQ